MAVKPAEGHVDWINDDDPDKYIAPSAAKRLQGWIAEEKPPFQYFNWYWRLADRWLQWAEAQSDENIAAIAAETTSRANADATLQGNIDAEVAAREAHTNRTDNPHVVTKAQVGLGDVPNTDFSADVAANTNHRNATSGVHGYLASAAEIDARCAGFPHRWAYRRSTSASVAAGSELLMITSDSLEWKNGDFALIEVAGQMRQTGTAGFDLGRCAIWPATGLTFTYSHTPMQFDVPLKQNVYTQFHTTGIIRCYQDLTGTIEVYMDAANCASAINALTSSWELQIFKLINL